MGTTSTMAMDPIRAHAQPVPFWVHVAARRASSPSTSTTLTASRTATRSTSTCTSGLQVADELHHWN
jgi:hypothetical protein